MRKTFAIAWMFLAAISLFHSRFTVAGVKLSPSLPEHVFLIRKGEQIQRGDYVAFRWPGGGPYKAGSTFVKLAAGIPGDTVERQGRRFFVNGVFVGEAKERSRDGATLELADAGMLGPNEYYVMTPHPDSLDSRYKLTGRIHAAAMIGKAYPLF